MAKNVLGTALELCSLSPVTGFQRDGFCRLLPGDRGEHTVCAIVDEAFLNYTKQQGNDLSTPIPAFGFEGLKPGDAWCLCLGRWLQAHRAGVAPPIRLASCDASVLEKVDLETLKSYALSTS